ncbi:MAG: two pore domain potassium channel family protein [Firmicutes bacterium]|nr:two pore domain potassium channel family protein [Bacillota bacterium]
MKTNIKVLDDKEIEYKEILKELYKKNKVQEKIDYGTFDFNYINETKDLVNVISKSTDYTFNIIDISSREYEKELVNLITSRDSSKIIKHCIFVNDFILLDTEIHSIEYIKFEMCLFLGNKNMFRENSYKMLQFIKCHIDKSMTIKDTNINHIQIIDNIFGDLLIESNDSIKSTDFLEIKGTEFRTNERSLTINNIKSKKIVLDSNCFNGYLKLESINVESIIRIKNINIRNIFAIKQCEFLGDLEIKNLILQQKSLLYIYNLFLYQKYTLTFEKLEGQVVFDKIYYNNYVKERDIIDFDFEKIKNKEYKSLIINEDIEDIKNFEDIIEITNFTKITKKNFHYYTITLKKMNVLDEYFEGYYYYKKYERISKKFSLIDFTVEKTTKYFTSWKRILKSYIITTSIYLIVCLSFPNKILDGDNNHIVSRNTIEILVTDLLGKGDISEKVSWIFNNIDTMLLKTKEIVYFVLITASTVGFGDYKPTSFLQLITGVFAIMSVFFTSSFIAVLINRYSRDL